MLRPAALVAGILAAALVPARAGEAPSDGLFERPERIGKGLGRDFRPLVRGMALADFDGDSFLDLLIVHEDERPLLYPNVDGEAEFEDDQANGIPDSVRGRGMAVGDVDLDGDLDVYIVGEADTLLINDGTGEFLESAAALGLDACSPAAVCRGAVLGDFDQDGDVDIYVATEAGSPNFIYERLPTGSWAVSSSILQSPTGMDALYSYQGPVVADFNSDSYLDVYVPSATAGGTALVLMGTTGGLLDRTDGALSAPHPVLSCVAFDVDLDGDLDVLEVEQGGGLRLLSNDGIPGLTIQFLSVILDPSIATITGDFYAIAAAHLDQDPYLDVVVTADTGDRTRYFFSTQPTYPFLVDQSDEHFPDGGDQDRPAAGLALGDVNNDGFIDVVTKGHEEERSVLSINRGSAFVPTNVIQLDIRGPGGVLQTESGASIEFRDGDGDLLFLTSVGFTSYASSAPNKYSVQTGAGSFTATIRFSRRCYPDAPFACDAPRLTRDLFFLLPVDREASFVIERPEPTGPTPSPSLGLPVTERVRIAIENELSPLVLAESWPPAAALIADLADLLLTDQDMSAETVALRLSLRSTLASMLAVTASGALAASPPVPPLAQVELYGLAHISLYSDQLDPLVGPELSSFAVETGLGSLLSVARLAAQLPRTDAVINAQRIVTPLTPVAMRIHSALAAVAVLDPPYAEILCHFDAIVFAPEFGCLAFMTPLPERFVPSTSELGGMATVQVHLLGPPPTPRSFSLTINDTSEVAVAVPTSAIVEAVDDTFPQIRDVVLMGMPDLDDDGRRTARLGLGSSVDMVPAGIAVANNHVSFPEITGFEPATVARQGGRITISGARFEPGIRVSVAGVLALEPAVVLSPTALVVESPRLPVENAYVSVRVQNTNGGATECPLEPGLFPIADGLGIPGCDSSGQLFVSAGCPEGEYGASLDDCKPCPSCGVCPGGDRVWPIPGCWSAGEQDMPGPCQPAEACPGGRPGVDDLCAEGYEGPYCGRCSSDFFRDDIYCQDCRAPVVAVGLLLSLCAIFFGVLCIGVVVLKTNTLDVCAAILLGLQQAVVIGQVAGEMIPEAREAFAFLSLLLFEPEFIRPGCSVGAVSFSDMFFVTLGVIAAVAVMVVACAYLRAFYKTLMEGDDASPEQRIFRFRCRALNALLLLAWLVYILICKRVLTAINCVEVGGELVLNVERSQPCYQGAHTPVAVFAWLLFAGYIIGMPLALLFKLRVLFLSRSGAIYYRKDVRPYRFLFRYVRPAHYYFQVLGFVPSFFIALDAVMLESAPARLLAATVVVLINSSLVLALWPYRVDLHNYLSIASGYGKAVQALVLVAIGSPGSTGEFSTILALVILMGVLLMGGVIKRFQQLSEAHGSGLSGDDGKQTHYDDSSDEEGEVIMQINRARRESGRPESVRESIYGHHHRPHAAVGMIRFPGRRSRAGRTQSLTDSMAGDSDGGVYVPPSV